MNTIRNRGEMGGGDVVVTSAVEVVDNDEWVLLLRRTTVLLREIEASQPKSDTSKGGMDGMIREERLSCTDRRGAC
jgi:hypothetical protein